MRIISALVSALLALLMFSSVVLGQPLDALVTLQEVDDAMAEITASTTPDDPKRAQLLTLYNDTRVALTDRAEFLDLSENYAKARAGAGKEAVAMGASLEERHVAPPDAPASTSRAELEQQLQLSKAE